MRPPGRPGGGVGFVLTPPSLLHAEMYLLQAVYYES